MRLGVIWFRGKEGVMEECPYNKVCLIEGGGIKTCIFSCKNCKFTRNSSMCKFECCVDWYTLKFKKQHNNLLWKPKERN